MTTAWVWGGGLLIASAVVPLIGYSSAAGPAASNTASWVGMLAFSAAMLLFAFGWRRRGSVVAGRTAGVIALIVLALATPAYAAVTSILLSASGESALEDPGVYSLLYYIDLTVRAGAGALAAVAVGRARVVPPPWCWAPAWGLAALVGTGVLVQVTAVAMGGREGAAQTLLALVEVSSIVSILVPLLLGVLAIVLGVRGGSDEAPRAAVQVYPNAS